MLLLHLQELTVFLVPLSSHSMCHHFEGLSFLPCKGCSSAMPYCTLTWLWLLQGRRMALISSACLHRMAAANSHMPAWPAPALAARPGRFPLLL